MQINYTMINSQSQLCEKAQEKGRKTRWARERQREIREKNSRAFNFSGGLFFKHAIVDNFMLEQTGEKLFRSAHNFFLFSYKNRQGKKMEWNLSRTGGRKKFGFFVNCFKSTIKYSKHLPLSQRIWLYDFSACSAAVFLVDSSSSSPHLPPIQRGCKAFFAIIVIL